MVARRAVLTFCTPLIRIVMAGRPRNELQRITPCHYKKEKLESSGNRDESVSCFVLSPFVPLFLSSFTSSRICLKR